MGAGKREAAADDTHSNISDKIKPEAHSNLALLLMFNTLWEKCVNEHCYLLEMQANDFIFSMIACFFGVDKEVQPRREQRCKTRLKVIRLDACERK